MVPEKVPLAFDNVSELAPSATLPLPARLATAVPPLVSPAMEKMPLSVTALAAIEPVPESANVPAPIVVAPV
jgi:hypothetical protein